MEGIGVTADIEQPQLSEEQNVWCREHLWMHGVLFFVRTVCEYQSKDMSVKALYDAMVNEVYKCFPMQWVGTDEKNSMVGEGFEGPEAFYKFVILARGVDVLKKYVKPNFDKKPFGKFFKDIQLFSVERILRQLTLVEPGDFICWILDTCPVTDEERTSLSPENLKVFFAAWVKEEKSSVLKCLRTISKIGEMR